MRLRVNRAGLAALAAGTALLLYIRTLAPTVAAGDAGELALAGWRGAIPHPPGYPLWVAAAWVFLRLPGVSSLGEVAVRANLLSALFGALAAGGVVVVAGRLGLSRPASLLAAGLVALAPAVWHSATAAEVYSLNLLLLVVLALAWLRLEQRPGRGGAAMLGAAWGLLLVHHPANVLLLPLLPFSFRRLRIRAAPGPVTGAAGVGTWRTASAAALGLALGLSPALWPAWRAAARPDLDWFGAAGLARFGDNWLRGFYGPLRQNPYDALATLRQSALTQTELMTQIGPALFLSLVGFVCWARQRPAHLKVMGAAIAISLAGPWLLINPKPDAEHLLSLTTAWYPALLGLALAAGAGFDALRTLGRWLGARPNPVPAGPAGPAPAPRRDRPGTRTLWGAAPSAATLLVLLLLAQRAAAGWTLSDRSDDRVARAYAEDLLGTVPPGGVLFVEGDNEMFLTAYLQQAGGVRTDVRVIHRKGYLFEDPFRLRTAGRGDLAARRDAAEAAFVAGADRPVYFVALPGWAAGTAVMARREGLLWRVAPEIIRQVETGRPAPWPWTGYHADVWEADPERLDYVTRKCLVAYYEGWAETMARAGREAEATSAWRFALKVGHDFPEAPALLAALTPSAGEAR